jgi:hypothetical protein
MRHHKIPPRTTHPGRTAIRMRELIALLKFQRENVCVIRARTACGAAMRGLTSIPLS